MATPEYPATTVVLSGRHRRLSLVHPITVEKTIEIDGSPKKRTYTKKNMNPTEQAEEKKTTETATTATTTTTPVTWYVRHADNNKNSRSSTVVPVDESSPPLPSPPLLRPHLKNRLECHRIPRPCSSGSGSGSGIDTRHRPLPHERCWYSRGRR